MATVQHMILDQALRKLVDRAEQEAYKVLGVKEEIQKLRRRLTRISSFLQDAERKRHTDAAISTWVKELKDIMYDADDIIDLCTFGGGKLLELQQHPPSSPMRFPLSLLSSCFSCVKYRHEIANRIEELNDRLKEISEDNQVLSKLVESSNQGSQGSVVSSRATSPIQVESEIVGTQIENATNDIIKWIAEDDQKRCQVYGIVGMGGIGKTTLACRIFNHQKIIDNFPTRIWLYISKNYSETELLKEFIRASTGGNDDEAESIAELGMKLVRALRSKNRKILLVLDDLWSADVWNNLLRTHIVSSEVIGRILITSRDVNIGRAVGASNSHIHRVEKINREGGWELLRKIIFSDGDESMMPVLKDVGIKIVARCDGLPLAIKVVAGILFCKERTRNEWENVLENDLWRMNQIDDEIPRALYLSYEDLPSKLKPCFLSCALFSGSTYYSRLVTLWMAEGFIAEQHNMLMEELGENYYNELVSRNLLQLDPEYVDGRFFMMHDLLRSLAINLIEEGISLREGETLNTNNLSTKIRRLSMSNKGNTLTLPSVIKEQNCLRVLLVYNSPKTITIEDETLKILKRLRVLDLSDTSIWSIPNSIGKLLHMRCLYLDRTNIRELPESVGHLMNLQTLSIQYCPSLYRLPKSITRLYNLRRLQLFGTLLTHIPKGIGKLMNINYLDGFVVGCDDSASGDQWFDLEDLQYLSNMRYLDMQRLERASIKEGATVLANQTFLRRLCINWTIAGDMINVAPSTSDEGEIIKRAESVCRQLIPPSSLEDFKIYNFPVERFPDWIMSISLGASFPHLAYLTLNNLPLCTVLPPLGQLPQLKYLVIRRVLGIKKIGSEFLGCHGSFRFLIFPKLNYLHFEDMPNWEKWVLWAQQVEEKVGDKKNHLRIFPNLTKCVLIGCSRLIALPEAFYHATNLNRLDVCGCERIERISNLPPLKSLCIEDCSSLEHVENCDTKSLYFTCPPTNNEFLPHWLLDLVAKHHRSQHFLREFYMRCSLPLLKSCLQGKPNWHIIRQIPHVYIKTIDDEHWMEYTKDPPFYDTTVVVDSECVYIRFLICLSHYKLYLLLNLNSNQSYIVVYILWNLSFIDHFVLDFRIDQISRSADQRFQSPLHPLIKKVHTQ